MNNKQLVALLLMGAVFYFMFLAPSSQAGTVQTSAPVVTDCGRAPGDADIVTKLSWALCESKKSADADAHGGGR